uniref:Uncharacterized protein n=2 Tax=Avena sativa TaxID=4498 RepID=A0ACD5ZCH9_AVESA
MGLRQTRRRRSSQQPGPCGDGTDHISRLPDDLLLILSGLGCTASAARTSGLSRRWRGLWTHLGDISLRDVPFQSLAAVLSLVARPPPPIISLLEIRVPSQNRRVPREHWPARADVASLMRAAARLAPERLVLALPPGGSNPNPADVHLPCFRRATSIVLESLPFVLRAPAAAGEFAALRKLHLLDCIVMDEDLDALLSLCPCLRVLLLRHRTTTWTGDPRWRTVHSATLEELTVDSERAWASRVDIAAPAVKQLGVSFWAYDEMTISISAPMVEKFWWHCRYVKDTIGFGLWSLHMLRLETAQGQLPSLQIYAGNSNYAFSDEEANLAHEIEKHMVIEFSDLELHLSAMGHVFGALVLHILGMNRVRNAIRRLMVFRETFRAKEACPANCPCEPTDWRTQIISLTALEEVEIDGFEGDVHEYDLLELIFNSSPMLKRMTVKFPRIVSSSDDACTKIHDIFAAHSSVDCLVYLSSGLLHRSPNCAPT